MLNVLVSESYPTFNVPITPFAEMLQRAHNVDPVITLQVIKWFGSSDDENWEAYVDEIVKVIGLALLSQHKASLTWPLLRLPHLTHCFYLGSWN